MGSDRGLRQSVPGVPIPTPDVSGDPPRSQAEPLRSPPTDTAWLKTEGGRASNGQMYTYTPPHPAELSLTDWLDQELAAEEHQQGKPIGERGHCSHCDKAAEEIERGIARARQLRLQAECEHEEAGTIEMTMLGQPRRELLRTCRECGLSWREEGEWL